MGFPHTYAHEANAFFSLGRSPLNRFHLYCVLLSHGKKRTLVRATAL